MEVRTFAERVLFGDSLSDKLVAPAAGTPLTDSAPGRPIGVPSSPGRPRALALRADRALTPFPSKGRLAEPASAAAALHTFANHELLALELMALALLRFPDAAPRFRRELVATMRDEQRHMRLYLDRMEELGGGFGDHSTSPFFWDCLAGVDSVDAFVAGMSLTLEQANLDFAEEYAAAFDAVGDDVTASLLRRVHREEIVHVARGVHHFARVRPGEDLWDVFTELLPPPLTPRRARGATFAAQARADAGLPEGFVRKVRWYAHSRGRRPILYRWTPAVEDTLRLGPHHTRSALVADLERDLETLPLLLASEDDAVAVSVAPSMEWLETVAAAGLPIPRFVTPGEEIDADRTEPWGLAPGDERWSEALRPLYDKRTSAAWLGALRDALDEASGGRVIGAHLLPHVVEDETTAWAVANELRALGPVVFKQGLGASGRGQLRWLDEPAPTEAQRAWVRRHVGQGLRVEPWLVRRADLSVHFDATEDGLVPRGIVRFDADRRGRFRTASLGAPTHGLGQAERRFLAGDGTDPRWLDRVVGVLARELPLGPYRGPVGVDAMLALDPRSERLVLHPLLEVNPRWTFGRLALRLRRLAARDDLLALVPPDAVSAGDVCLNDPARARRVVAVWRRGAR